MRIDSLSYLRGSELEIKIITVNGFSLSYLRGSEQLEKIEILLPEFSKLPTRQ